MAAPPNRPALRERYDRRRDEVVLGAARVFAERGYDQTSMGDLGAELDIAAGGLYHYIGSKEQLLISICDELTAPLLGTLGELAAADERPARRLREFVRIWVAHVVEHRDHLLVFQQERHVIEHGPQWRGVRRDRKRFEQLLDDALAQVQDAGELRLADRRVALSALLGMVNHTVQWFRPSGRLSAQDVADGYVELILSA